MHRRLMPQRILGQPGSTLPSSHAAHEVRAIPRATHNLVKMRERLIRDLVLLHCSGRGGTLCMP
jgi:hypothetical protein